MNSSEANKENNIGTLRFLGAFLVLYGHSYSLSAVNQVDPVSPWLVPYTPWHQPMQSLGVTLFFVLSGYLVTQSYLRRKNIFSYLLARCARIYPALIFAVLFCVYVVGFSQTTLSLPEYFHHPLTKNYFWHNLTLVTPEYVLPGVFDNLPNQWSVNGSLWTLPVELRLYFIVGFLGLFGMLSRPRLFNAVLTLGLIYFLVFPELVWHHLCPFKPYLVLSFAIGAFVYVNRAKQWINLKTLLILVCLLAVTFYKNVFGVYDYLSLLTLAVLVLYVSLHIPVTFPKLDKYGDFSYGLYLYAFPLQQLSVTYFGEGKPLTVLVVSFGGALSLAILSWFVIEKPTLRLVRDHTI